MSKNEARDTKISQKNSEKSMFSAQFLLLFCINQSEVTLNLKFAIDAT